MARLASDDPFRYAVVGGGVPRPARDVIDPDRKRWMLDFLRSGEPVLTDPFTFGVDPVDRSRPRTVPRGYRTDGDWIWPDALAYFLERYDIPPTRDFEDWMYRHGYHPALVSAGRVGQARADLLARGPYPFEPEDADQDRFPGPVYDVLVTYGWRPGRDIGPRVGAWWEGLGLAEAYPPDQLSAALAFLAEFGGLNYPVYGTGPDREIVQFSTYPFGPAPDPGLLRAAGQRLGGACVPIGWIIDLRRVLVVAPRGLFAAGAADDQYLGATFHETVRTLIQGIAPDGRR